MDVFLLIVTVFGLLYLFIAGVRWAFKLDKDEWRKRERKRMSRRERQRMETILQRIEENLKDEK